MHANRMISFIDVSAEGTLRSKGITKFTEYFALESSFKAHSATGSLTIIITQILTKPRHF